eukprot:793088-Pelagomonas_calceolata.AAC.2
MLLLMLLLQLTCSYAASRLLGSCLNAFLTARPQGPMLLSMLFLMLLFMLPSYYLYSPPAESNAACNAALDAAFHAALLSRVQPTCRVQCCFNAAFDAAFCAAPLSHIQPAGRV